VSSISVDNQVLGYVTITDAIKSTSVAAIKELMNQGIEVIMLTGDNENTIKQLLTNAFNVLHSVVCQRIN
jgi:Cu2+-exporting ATPase